MEGDSTKNTTVRGREATGRGINNKSPVHMCCTISIGTGNTHSPSPSLFPVCCTWYETLTLGSEGTCFPFDSYWSFLEKIHKLFQNCTQYFSVWLLSPHFKNQYFKTTVDLHPNFHFYFIRTLMAYLSHF
ncbi:hypothetical protein AMTRI_Chr03g148200 [Amborella trichopoda]